MRTGSRRGICLVVSLAIVCVAPTTARASTEVLQAPYTSAEAYESSSGGPLGRSSVEAVAEGSTDGRVHVSAHAEGPFAQSILYVDPSFADARVVLGIDHEVGRRLRSVSYVAHIRINRMTVEETDLYDPTAGGSRVGIYIDAPCFDCYAEGPSAEWHSIRGDLTITDEDIDIPFRVDAYQENVDLPSTITLSILFVAEVTSGFRRGSWTGTLDAVVTSIEATY